MDVEDAKDITKDYKSTRRCPNKYRVGESELMYCRGIGVHCRYFVLKAPHAVCGYFSQLEIAVKVLYEHAEPL
ncbi:MAG: hypothetical protein GY861_17405 [bacterium]|nr:hypothetical protein [bacterium]